jgi:hypothetical protein
MQGRVLSFAAISICVAGADLRAADRPAPGVMDVGGTPVKAENAGKAPTISYYLPKNYFEFRFKLTTTKTQDGKFCDVAKYFFEVPDDFKCEKPKPHYEVALGSEVTISEIAKPDTAQAYDLNVKAGTFTENNLTLGFGEGNVLTGYQSTLADHKVNFFVSILKTAADVVGHLIHAPTAALAAPALPTPSSIRTPLPGPDCSAELDRSEAALLRELSPAHKAYACALAPDLRSGYLHLPDQYRTYLDGKVLTNHLMNALALFIEYADLVKNEAQVLRPDRLPSSADGYATLAKARADRKKQIREQFLGSEQETTDPVPDIVWDFGASPATVELFSFDSAKKGGLCFKSVINERWSPRATAVPNCDSASTNLMTVFAELKQEGAVAGPAGGDAPANAGLAYRIPGRGALRVYAKKGATEYDYFRKSFDIAQYGAVRYLPSKIGNTTSYNVSLDPLTGALKSVVVGSQPVLTGDTAKSLGEVSAAMLGIVDAVKASKKSTELSDTTDDANLKLQQLKIQLIESCKGDPTQKVCESILE